MNDHHQQLLDAALHTATRGWPVFPLRPGGKVPALQPDGRPGWEKSATTDHDRIRRIWKRDSYNVGLATGRTDRLSGLAVLDIGDGKAFRDLCAEHDQPVPHTRIVRTAAGRTHLYFTAPVGVLLPSGTGPLPSPITLHAAGGYVVASGSVIGGRSYATVGPALLYPLPGWLQHLLIPRR
ncbi:bifunctional DNA primase/polymerase [Streptomyces sp. Ac-502]|uniref:bifunctional DNA primase/polymerase n=1 Tax=Streptomyces sp. Ac-502 TaxID=3342801 RepID=UPI00386246C6